MSEPSSEAQALPLELARDVEHRCNRFEVAWQGGTPPRLEDHVAEAPEAIRAALLRELILLDIHYRQARGESCHRCMTTWFHVPRPDNGASRRTWRGRRCSFVVARATT